MIYDICICKYVCISLSLSVISMCVVITISQMLHVWNISLQLPQYWPSFVGIHIPVPWFPSRYINMKTPLFYNTNDH